MTSSVSVLYVLQDNHGKKAREATFLWIESFVNGWLCNAVNLIHQFVRRPPAEEPLALLQPR